MVIMKSKEALNMSEKDLKNKIKDLKMELIKASSKRSAKSGSVKIKEIKKTIARLLTLLHIKSKQNKIKEKTKK